jgi:transposase
MQGCEGGASHVVDRDGLEGYDRKTAAEVCGMDRQTLRDWVHRYNAEGLEGLSNRRSGGRPARLTPEQKATLADWVRAGPDRARDGVVRWRRIDLKHRIKAEFGVVMHERTVGKHLAALVNGGDKTGHVAAQK